MGEQDAMTRSTCNRAEMEAFLSTPGCRRTVLAALWAAMGGKVCGHIWGAIPCS